MKSNEDIAEFKITPHEHGRNAKFSELVFDSIKEKTSSPPSLVIGFDAPALPSAFEREFAAKLQFPFFTINNL
jgi:hypothetical protein